MSRNDREKQHQRKVSVIYGPQAPYGANDGKGAANSKEDDGNFRGRWNAFKCGFRTHLNPRILLSYRMEGSIQLAVGPILYKLMCQAD